MNNFNFTKNPFNGVNNQTKIAGDHVFKNSDGGRMSLDEVRENMSSIKHPTQEVPKVVTPQPEAKPTTPPPTKFQNLRNIGRNNGN